MKATLPARPFSLLVWFALPAAILLSLVLNPPHELDAALARVVWANGAFPFQDEETLLVIHRYAALVPALIAACALKELARPFFPRFLSEPSALERAETGRYGYLLAAMLCCIATVWWLKGTTGVYCPWSTEGFGGSVPLASPTFSLSFRSGKCWPGGFAGTGFCMFALYFAFRDRHPDLARAGLAFALAFGGFCSAVQMIRGAHFLSHNLATLCIDWLVCASVYCTAFARTEVVRQLSPAGLGLALAQTLGLKSAAKKEA